MRIFSSVAHAAIEVKFYVKLADFSEGKGEVVHDSGDGIGVERGRCGFIASASILATEDESFRSRQKPLNSYNFRPTELCGCL